MFKPFGSALTKRILQRRQLCTSKPTEGLKDEPNPKRELFLDRGFHTGLWIGGACGLSRGYDNGNLYDTVMSKVGRCLITTPIFTFAGGILGLILGRGLYAISPCKPCMLGVGMIGAGIVTLFAEDYIAMRKIQNFGRF